MITNISIRKALCGFLVSLTVAYSVVAQMPSGYFQYAPLNKPGITVYTNGHTVVYKLDFVNQAKVDIGSFRSLAKDEDIRNMTAHTPKVLDSYPVNDPWKQRELIDFFFRYHLPSMQYHKMVSTSLFHTLQTNCGANSGAISLLPFKTSYAIYNVEKQVQARAGQKRLLVVNYNTTLAHQQADITNVSLANAFTGDEDYSKTFLEGIFGTNEQGIIGYDPNAFITNGTVVSGRALAGVSGNFLYIMVSNGATSPTTLATQLTGFGILANKIILLDSGNSGAPMCTGAPAVDYFTDYFTSYITIQHN